MRKLTIILILTLIISANPVLSAGPQTIQQTQEKGADSPLTNDDVLMLVKNGIAPEIIIAKIKTSSSKFDTSPSAMQNLKQAGVPDAVILAMVEAGINTAAASPIAATAEPVEVKVPDGTDIEIQLTNNASGQELKVGDLVDFTVVRPVEINGVLIFNKDASARARITTAKKSGRWGKAGKLEWAMQDVQAVDGNRIPARFTQRLVGSSSGSTVAVAAVATTVLLGPVGLLWGLKKGKPAIIPAGNRYHVFVNGDTTVKGIPVSKTTP